MRLRGAFIPGDIPVGDGLRAVPIFARLRLPCPARDGGAVSLLTEGAFYLLPPTRYDDLPGQLVPAG